MTLESLIPHGDFVGLEGVTHLCTGGEAPWFKDQVETYAEFARCKSGGDRGPRLIYETGERCRERMGALWGGACRAHCFYALGFRGHGLFGKGFVLATGRQCRHDKFGIPVSRLQLAQFTRRGGRGATRTA